MTDILASIDRLDTILAPIPRKNILREKFAELEHVQWATWANYMLNNMTPENIERWKRQIATKYENLSNIDKDKDREWADQVIKILEETNEFQSPLTISL